MFIEPAFNNVGHRGWIEVICGPMFSGKTEELLRRLKRSQIAGQQVAIFKPVTDKRYSSDSIVSHNKNNIPSISVDKPMEIINHRGRAKIVGIDEVQFFNHQIVEIAQQLALDNVRVIAAGLDMDYLGKPFGPVPELLATAEFVTKVHAICMICGSLATHSFRKERNDSRVMLGADNEYMPLCRKCFNEEMGKKKEHERTIAE